jgi:WD40 repeat protein
MDTETWQTLMTIEAHNADFVPVAFNPDGTLLASGGGAGIPGDPIPDSSIRLWDVASGRRLRTLEGQILAVQNIAFSPDGTLFASVGGDGTIRLWGVPS